MSNKTRIEVAPVMTLGDLIELVSRARSAVDETMRHQTQAETPIKIEVTIGGKLKAVTLTELDPERIGATRLCGHSNANECVDDGCWGKPKCVVCRGPRPADDPYGEVCGPGCAIATGR